jgi:drug/metabolite transporter (DMT)-like permease
MVMLNIKKSNFTVGASSIILGSMFLGSVGVFVRYAGEDIQPMTQSFGRLFVAFLLISVMNILRRNLKKEVFHVTRKDLGFLILNGIIGFTITVSTFTLSILYTSISNTYFLLYTAPVFAAIFGSLFLKEKVKRYIVISIAISMVGLFFIFNPTNQVGSILGNIFGLIAGISFGAYFVLTGYLGKRHKSPTITFWTQAFGSLGLIPLIFIFDKGSSSFELSAWLPVIAAGFAVFCGYYLLNHGLTKISPSAGSILSLFEILSSVIYSMIIFAEFPSAFALIGAGFILLSIINLTYNQSKATEVAK